MSVITLTPSLSPLGSGGPLASDHPSDLPYDPSLPIEYRVALGDYGTPAHQSELIVPKWWEGSPAIPPSAFEIDCSNEGDLRKLAALSPEDLAATPLVQRMVHTFKRTGLLLLTHTALTADDVDVMQRLALCVLGEEKRYKGGGNARNTLNANTNVYDVGAPLCAPLHYHHEMAYVNESTTALAFMCLESLPDRGATFVSDSLSATIDLLATPFGRRLREKGVCYVRHLSDARNYDKNSAVIGVYNHWQKSFDTEDKDEAERRAIALGLKVEWRGDGTMSTRFYTSAFEYFPALDRNVLYASVADTGMWFDGWPGVMHVPMNERPLDMTFGDDTPFTHEEKQQFVSLYDGRGIKIDWRVGDVAVVCNYRFAHGRPGIDLMEGERRRLGVLLGKGFERQGDREGKWE